MIPILRMDRIIDMRASRRFHKTLFCVTLIAICQGVQAEEPQRIQDVIEPEQSSEHSTSSQTSQTSDMPSPTRPPTTRRRKAKREEAPPVKNAPVVSSPSAPSLNSTAQAAHGAGVLDCVARINQVTNFVAGNNKTGVFLFLPPIEVNRHIVSASLEIVGQDGSAYAPLSAGGGCGAVYETIANWPQSCEVVARTAFASFKPAGGLARAVAMLDGGPNARVFLLPATQGCTSIKKEVIYP